LGGGQGGAPAPVLTSEWNVPSGNEIKTFTAT